MISLVSPFNERKQNENRYQHPEDEESQFLDCEILNNNRISFSLDDRNEIDLGNSNFMNGIYVNEKDYSKQVEEPKYSGNISSESRNQLLLKSIKESNAIITEKIREILRENEVTHPSEENQSISCLKMQMHEREEK